MTTTARWGYYVKNDVGVGTITTQYGVYIESMTRGGTNWAIYCAGANVPIFAALPTSNPGVAGKWWANAGVVTIS